MKQCKKKVLEESCPYETPSAKSFGKKAENKISIKNIGPTFLGVFDILKEFDMIKHDETRLMELMEGH